MLRILGRKARKLRGKPNLVVPAIEIGPHDSLNDRFIFGDVNITPRGQWCDEPMYKFARKYKIADANVWDRPLQPSVVTYDPTLKDWIGWEGLKPTHVDPYKKEAECQN